MRCGRLLLLAVVLPIAGCGTESLEGRAVDEPAGMTPAVVDSAVPIAVALDRFRADLGRAPEAFDGGQPAPELLLRELDFLLARQDTAGLAALALDRAEFAYLYYESSPLSAAPYELPPELMWFQTQQENRTGMLRLLREFGGRGIGDAELICPDPPIEQGANEIWSGCRVRVAGAGAEVQLFGSIIGLGGTYKILSYANDF